MAIKKIKMHPPGNNTDVLHPETESAMVLTNSGNTIHQDLLVETAGGTATALTLTIPTLYSGYQKTFIAASNNNGAATTINTKPLYKPGTTTAPTLVAGRAYTVWYNGTSFFCKASAVGTAVAADVLATKTFSNDSDVDVLGTMVNRGAVTITPSNTSQAITQGYHNGAGYVAGSANLAAPNIKKDVNIFGTVGSLVVPTLPNTRTMVVDTGETIAVGDPVTFAGYGKAIKADGYDDYLESMAYAASDITDGVMCRLDDTHIFVCYKGTTYMTGYVLTVDPDTGVLTAGTVSVSTLTLNGVAKVVALSSTRVLIQYTNTSGYSACTYATISGTTVSAWGSANVMSGANLIGHDIAALSATRGVVVYITGTGSNTSVAKIVSNTGALVGSSLTIGTTSVENITIAPTGNPVKACIGYHASTTFNAYNLDITGDVLVQSTGVTVGNSLTSTGTADEWLVPMWNNLVLFKWYNSTLGKDQMRIVNCSGATPANVGSTFTSVNSIRTITDFSSAVTSRALVMTDSGLIVVHAKNGNAYYHRCTDVDIQLNRFVGLNALNVFATDINSNKRFFKGAIRIMGYALSAGSAGANISVATI